MQQALRALLLASALARAATAAASSSHLRGVGAAVAGPGPSGTCGKEDCSVGAGCATPQFPGMSDLPLVGEMPDLFTFQNGSAVATKAAWTCRRSEINQLMQNYELGLKTPLVSDVSGSVSAQGVAVHVSAGGKSIDFTATVQLPASGSKPYPFLIGIGGVSLNAQSFTSKGIAIITFPNDAVAAQQTPASHGVGKFFDLFGKDASAGALVAWAWGVSRMLDVVEADTSGLLDMAHVAVTGCSRNAKGALVVGALDERIALTIPQESGSGGSASWRVSDWMGPTVQTLEEIVGENAWFSPKLVPFAQNNNTDHLPFDHHSLQGLVAPRGLLVIENTGMVWLGNLSCWDNSVAGHKTYEALGVPDNMGISQVGGHNHCAFPPSQQPVVDAFVSKFMLGDASANTKVMSTDGGFTFDAAKWAPWPVPSLS